MILSSKSTLCNVSIVLPTFFWLVFTPFYVQLSWVGQPICPSIYLLVCISNVGGREKEFLLVHKQHIFNAVRKLCFLLGVFESFTFNVMTTNFGLELPSYVCFLFALLFCVLFFFLAFFWIKVFFNYYSFPPLLVYHTLI